MRTAIGFALLASAWYALSAGAAALETPGAEATRTVSFADLDVTHKPGAAALYSRIRAAAHAVCEPSYTDQPYAALTVRRHCLDRAIGQAVSDVDAPALTSYHRERTGASISSSTSR